MLLGATASGKSALAMELARRDPSWELVSVDSMQVYRGMDIGTAKPTPAERAEVPHHLLDLLDPWEDGTVAWFQRRAGSAIAEIEARGRRALLVGGTALYLQAIVDELDIPSRYPDVRAELEADPDTGRLHARLDQLDPVAAGRMEATNRRRVVRALEVTLGSGRPFSSFGPGLDVHPPTTFTIVGLRRTADDLRARASRPASPTRSRRASSTRYVDSTPSPRASPARPPRPSGTGSWRTTSPGRSASTRPSRSRSSGRAGSPDARWRGSAAIRGSPGSTWSPVRRATAS